MKHVIIYNKKWKFLAFFQKNINYFYNSIYTKIKKIIYYFGIINCYIESLISLKNQFPFAFLAKKNVSILLKMNKPNS